jgi:hypothetical protein
MIAFLTSHQNLLGGSGDDRHPLLTRQSIRLFTSRTLDIPLLGRALNLHKP